MRDRPGRPGQGPLLRGPRMKSLPDWCDFAKQTNRVTMKSPVDRKENMAGEFGDLDRRFLLRILPGLRLVGAIRMAFDLRKLTIAAPGIGIASEGLVDSGLAVSRVSVNHSRPVCVRWEREASISARSHGRLTFFGSSFPALQSHFAICSFRCWLSSILGATWATMLHAILRMTWLFLVWGICGGAICRIAVVRIAADPADGCYRGASIFPASGASLVLAPYFPLLGSCFARRFLRRLA